MCIRDRAWWARSDADFDNNATGYTNGKGEAGARAKIQLSEMFGVFGEAIRSEDRALAGEAVRTGEKLGVTAKVTDKLTLDGFVRHISEDGNLAPQALIGSNNAPLGGTLKMCIRDRGNGYACTIGWLGG